EAHLDPTSRRPLDPADHPAVGDVRVDDVEPRRRAVEEPRDRVGDRSVPPRSVVQHDGRDRSLAGLEWRKERVRVVDPAAEPEEARDEDELELADDRSFEADEEVVESAV